MRKVYLDRSMGEAVSVYSRDAEVIPAGTTVYSMPYRCRNAEYDRWQQAYGIGFLFDDMRVEIPFYAVPWVDIFAVDKEGGYLGTLGQQTDLQGNAPICYMKDRKCFLIAESGPDFIKRASSWRGDLTEYTGVKLYDSREQAARMLEFVATEAII